MSEQKKSKKIKLIVGLLIVIAGVSIAVITANRSLENVVTSGTVSVESINLQLIDEKGNSTKNLTSWDPGNLEKITWTVKNTGTAAVYTRNKLRIYWNKNVPDEEQVLYLYPANISKQDILADIAKGDNAEYAIKANYGTITLDDGSTKKGFEYEILGDVLDGSEMTGLSEEVNYNSKSFEPTTDDTSAVEDSVAYNLLLSPDTSYLYGKHSLTIEVITEAMQCTEDGKEEWHIVGTQSLGN